MPDPNGAPDEALPFDRRIADLAATQDRVVTRSQLIEAGVTRGSIERRLASGHLYRLMPGSYAVGVPLLDQRMLLRAALLRAGDGSGLADLAASAHLGLTVPRLGEATVASPRRGLKSAVKTQLRMQRLHDSGALVEPEIFTRFAADLDEDLMTADGLCVTAVPRTLVDLAGRAPFAFDHAWNEAEFRRVLDVEAVQAVLDRKRWPGAARVRAAIDTYRAIDVGEHGFDDLSESEAVQQLVAAGVPAPEINVWFTIDGERYRADLYWRHARLIVELDGWGRHGTRPAFENDRHRDNEFLGIGILTMRFTRRRFVKHPADCAARIAAMIDERTSRRRAA